MKHLFLIIYFLMGQSSLVFADTNFVEHAVMRKKQKIGVVHIMNNPCKKRMNKRY